MAGSVRCQRRVRSRFLTASLCLLLNACAMAGGTVGTGINSWGGGTAGTGLAISDSERMHSMNVDFTVNGVVLNQNGYPLSGAKISARMAAGERHDISSKNGRFTLPISMHSGEEILFSVVSGKGRSTCRTMLSPAGETEVGVTLRVAAGGQLICSN